MNEAELNSASRGKAGVQPGVLSPPIQGLAESAPQPKRRTPRLPHSMQAAIAILATAIAFAPSLIWLPRDLPRGVLSLVPLVSLLLAGGIALFGLPWEPNIHDRYLDYILGGALLGLAALGLLFLPESLSIFFWSWRLDVLALIFFAAGAITLLCGTRALWRYRLPAALLILCWPVSVQISLPLAGRVGEGVPISLIAIPALVWLALNAVRRRPRQSARQDRSVKTGGGVIAAAIVVVAAVIAAAADRQVAAAGGLLNADGAPLIAANLQAPAAVGTFQRTTRTDAAGFPSWGLTGALAVYGDPVIAVNLFLPPDRRELALPPTTVAERQGYRLLTDERVDLGDDVFGTVDRYAGPSGGTLLVVWWDWPVTSSKGTARERVIAEQLGGSGVQSDRVIEFARAFVASAASPLTAS